MKKITAKTPLLSALRQAFRLAVFSKQPGSPPIDELVEWRNAMQRRTFLHKSAMGGIGLTLGANLLSSCTKEKESVQPTVVSNNETASNRQAPKIAIIGAGIAGLNCAYQLKKQGISSTVFEGSERAGGRIYTVKNEMAQGLTTELGGEFIDSGHEDMLALAAEFGLELIDTQEASQSSLIKDAFFFNNHHKTLTQVIEAFTPFAASIQSDIDSLPEEVGYAFPGSTMGFDDISIADYFQQKGITGWLRELLDVAYLTEYGLETYQQSAINFLFLFSPDTSGGSFDVFGESDERYKIKGGNQKVTDKLYKEVKNQVTFGTRLVRLKKIGKTFELTFGDNCAGGKVQNFDAVVLALPFTLLRQVEILVELPPVKEKAIKQLGYGTNAKLMIGLKKRIWTQQGYQGYVFTDKPFQLGWDNSQLQPGTAGGYTVFTGGNQGVAMGQGSAQSQLNQMLPGLNQCFPGFSNQLNGNLLRFHWPTFQWTKGSYAAYKVGQWKSFAGAEGERVGKLFFCGEHCSIDYQGYMNGGAQTGREAAEAILSDLGLFTQQNSQRNIASKVA